MFLRLNQEEEKISKKNEDTDSSSSEGESEQEGEAEEDKDKDKDDRVTMSQWFRKEKKLGSINKIIIHIATTL